jgi:hypothetical protein
MIDSRSHTGHLRRILSQSFSQLVRGPRKWDKENRSRWGSANDVDLPRSEPEAELVLLKSNRHKRMNHSDCRFYQFESDRLGSYFRLSGGNPVSSVLLGNHPK